MHSHGKNTVGVIFLQRRAVTVFLIMTAVFCGLGLRINSLTSRSEQAAVTQSAMTVELDTLYGTIYDCNLEPLTNAESEIYAAAKPTNQALAELKKILLPDVFDSVMERMSNGKPVTVKVDSIGICTDIRAVAVPKRYEKTLACHVIGYRNSEGGVSGIEKAYNSLIERETDTVRVRFSSNAKGRVMIGEDIEVYGNGVPKTGVVLTLDKRIQQITEDALDNSGTVCGAAVVIDIESGAIRACASRPAFNRDNVSESLNDKNSPLINRAFLPFSVGSVFKPVIAAAALENGINEYEYNCTGSVALNGVTFNCHKHDGHGVLDIRQAVAVSCNTFFISLANEIGAENLTATAEKFGFGKEILFADGMKASAGYLPGTDELDSGAAIANFSFGQGSLLATPVQICAMMSAIANGGVYNEPYLIEGETDSDGRETKIKAYAERRQIISYETSEMLKEYLEAVVTEGSGKRASSEYVSVAGKTATAQTGKSENGEEIYNAWFAGYFPADNPKYAVAILKENGGEGAISCAPVFKEIAEKINGRP